jgi:hypothetical protein
MKKYWLALAAVAVAAAGWGPASAATKPMTPLLPAEVVSADAVGKTITVKALDQEGVSAPIVLKVSPKAAGALKALQSGDHVSLTCEAKARTTDPAPEPATLADCSSVTNITKS